MKLQQMGTKQIFLNLPKAILNKLNWEKGNIISVGLTETQDIILKKVVSVE